MPDVRLLSAAALALILLLAMRRVILAAVLGKKIGAATLARQPDRIQLVPATATIWPSLGVWEPRALRLQANGFVFVGHYTIPELPEIRLALHVNPAESFLGSVVLHPRVGTWVEISCRHTDGTRDSFGTLKPSGLDTPAGCVVERLPGASVDDLVQRALLHRQAKPCQPVAASNAVEAYQTAYAEATAQLKARGISRREVVKVASRRIA